AEVPCILQTCVDAIAAVRWVAVRRIAGDEDAALLIGVSDRETQFPKANVLELNVELRPGRGIDMLVEVEIVSGRAGRNRRVEEPGAAEVQTAEDFRVPAEVGMEDAVEGFAGIPLQQAMQAVRAEH